MRRDSRLKMLLMLDFITTNDAMMKRMKAEEGEKKESWKRRGLRASCQGGIMIRIILIFSVIKSNGNEDEEDWMERTIKQFDDDYQLKIFDNFSTHQATPRDLIPNIMIDWFLRSAIENCRMFYGAENFSIQFFSIFLHLPTFNT